jgi:hypothetical protein
MENEKYLFIDATITAMFYYFGDPKTKEILVNGPVNIGQTKLDGLDDFLIDNYGEFIYQDHTYSLEGGKVNYKIHYRAINSI